jgi:hypothetical protein
MELKITPKHLMLVLAGWTFALSATAQWQWIGKDGRKVFSDRPPTSDIQEKDILKQPGGKGPKAAPAPAPSAAPEGSATATATGATTGAAPSAAKPNANAPKISGKDAELEAKKKKLEDEEAVKKKADDEKIAKAKAENCERAKKSMATLQSGSRISTTNAKGEREIMDDSGRTAETKRLQGIIDSECN